MKNLSTRTVLFCLLVAASLGSYIFLNFASVQDGSENIFSAESRVEQYEEDLEGSESHIVLPDVQLIKRIVETGKRLIPAS